MNHRKSGAARGLAVSLAVAALACGAAPLAAADEFDRFAERAEAGPAISHEAFNLFLERLALDGNGRTQVAYTAAAGEGERFLKAYANGLAAISPAPLSADEQLAYWLNLRNALIVAEFCARGGRGDLKKLRGDFAAPGEAWTVKRVAVDGVELSIDDIERRIIFANFNDPRVIYGLYQASASGPRLPRKAFAGETVIATLEKLGRDFIEDGVRVRKGAIEAPAVFEWYREALFGGSDDGVKSHLLGLSSAADRSKLEPASTLAYAKFRYQIEKYEVRTAAPVVSGPSQGSFPTGS